MGASLALAGLTACNGPQEKIVPYVCQCTGTVAKFGIMKALEVEVIGAPDDITGVRVGGSGVVLMDGKVRL